MLFLYKLYPWKSITFGKNPIGWKWVNMLGYGNILLWLGQLSALTWALFLLPFPTILYQYYRRCWGVRCQYAIETYPPEMKGIHDACWNICHVGDDVVFALYERLKLREESGVKFCLRFSFYYKMFCHDENVLSCWCLCKVTDFLFIFSSLRFRYQA